MSKIPRPSPWLPGVSDGTPTSLPVRVPGGMHVIESAEPSDAAFRAALVEMLRSLPALPLNWPAGAVPDALWWALVRYEQAKGDGA